MDMSAVAAAFEGLKGTAEVLEGAIKRRDQTKIDAALSEFMPKLLAAYASAFQFGVENSSLLQERDTLKKQVAELKDWAAEKSRYELAEAAPGVMVMRVKEAMRGSEPMHQICADCYQDGRKSFLQSETRTPGRDDFLVCFGCGADICINGERRGDHGKPAGRRR